MQKEYKVNHSWLKRLAELGEEYSELRDKGELDKAEITASILAGHATSAKAIIKYLEIK